MNKRPMLLIIVSAVFILVGLGSFSAGLWPVLSSRTVPLDSVIVMVSGLTALISGVFMLRGANWARWLCIAWLVFHVALGFWHPLSKLVTHAVILVVVALILFRTSAARCFEK